jgi:predicted amidohydrolase
VRVAAVQFKPPKGNLPEAHRRLTRLAERAAADADLVVLPEMAATGYVFENVAQAAAIAEDPEGPTFQALAPIARQAGVWLVGGFAEQAPEGLYNSAWIIDPAGQLHAVYRKTLLFDADVPWARPGNSGSHRVQTTQGAFGVGICMDLNDDGFVDWCAQADLTAIAFPTNWLLQEEDGIDVWQYWAWRTESMSAALVAANTYGPEADIAFCGRSAIMRNWTVLAAAPPMGDGIIRADLRERATSREG